MGLELYSKIEQDLDFGKEIKKLYLKYLDILQNNKIDNILDVGCGQGEFMLLLQEHNIEVNGCDLSRNQINICLSKGLEARCVDIKDIDIKYSAITAIFDVLNYILPKDLEEFLQHIYNILEDNGYFIFDINSLFAFEELLEGTLYITKKDKDIIIDAKYNNFIAKTDIALYTKKEDIYHKEVDSIIQYYHNLEDIVAIATKIGFEVEELEEFYLYDYDKNDKIIIKLKRLK